MHRNYFTLLHAAAELDRKLRGGRLEGIHSQAQGEMTCTLTAADRAPLELVVFTRTPGISIFTRSGHHRKRQNSATLWPESEGLGIEGVLVHPTDRELHIRLEGGISLTVQVFAAKTAVFLLSADGELLRTFGRESAPPSPLPQGDAAGSIPERLRRLADSAKGFALHLRENREHGRDPLSGLPGFDRGLQRELLGRAGDDPSDELMFRHFAALAEQLLRPSPHVLKDPSGEPRFSILREPPEEGAAMESVLDALRAYSTASFSRLGTEGRMKAVRGELEARLKKIQKELEAMDPDSLEELARRQERFGHLLIASLYMERTSPASITVPDIFQPDAPPVEIPLEAALGLQENAARYFRKAAKTKNGREAMERRKEELRREAANVGERLERATEVDTPRKADAFIREGATQDGTSGGRSRGKAERKAPPFRSVRISGKATLLIGRNSAENERLTFGHARPDDIWLHARGASGSHCILKGSGPDHADELLRAASIAAWHSAAKHSALVPVMTAEKKHVRRSRNLPAGEVVVEREKVLFVRPSKDGSQPNP